VSVRDCSKTRSESAKTTAIAGWDATEGGSYGVYGKPASAQTDAVAGAGRHGGRPLLRNKTSVSKNQRDTRDVKDAVPYGAHEHMPPSDEGGGKHSNSFECLTEGVILYRYVISPSVACGDSSPSTPAG
jgi:hypothetical protein